MKNIVIEKMKDALNDSCYSFYKSSVHFGVFRMFVDDDAELYLQRIEIDEVGEHKTSYCVNYKNVTGLEVSKFIKSMDYCEVRNITAEDYKNTWNRFKNAKNEMEKDLFNK